MIKKIIAKQNKQKMPSVSKKTSIASSARKKSKPPIDQGENNLTALEHMTEKLPELIVAAIARCTDLAHTPTPSDPSESQRLTRATFLALKHLQELVNLVKKMGIKNAHHENTRINELIFIAQEAVSLMSQQGIDQEKIVPTAKPPIKTIE